LHCSQDIESILQKNDANRSQQRHGDTSPQGSEQSRGCTSWMLSTFKVENSLQERLENKPLLS
jgi:hypothetical protein